MSVKFSEFSIGTIGADLEIVGYDSATPTNVQVSYSDLKIDILGDAGTVTSIATTGPITGGTITGSGTIGINKATSSVDGYLSAADWTTFNSKGSGTVTSIGTSGPLTGGTIIGSGTIGITQASSSTDGYLSSTDFNSFIAAASASTAASLFNYYNFV